MAFSSTQIKNLGAKLNGRVVKTREANGRELSYIEGWHVIAEANRIFGFDAWDRETISNNCVWEGMKRGCPACAYIAKVRITVRAGPLTVTREGSGSGQGASVSQGEAHEIALKAAETDATKRALSTFGNPFGLALYDKEQVGVRKVRSRGASRGGASDHDGQELGDERQDPIAQGKCYGEAQERVDAQGDNHRTPVNGVPLTSAPVDNGRGEPRANTGPSPDKSALAIAEPRRLRRPEHLRFVATKPCLICGRGPSEAHHLTFAQPRGLQLKSSDEFTVPLCRAHHRQLHAGGNEESWWCKREIDALHAAADLWAAKGKR